MSLTSTSVSLCVAPFQQDYPAENAVLTPAAIQEFLATALPEGTRLLHWAIIGRNPDTHAYRIEGSCAKPVR